MPEEIELAFNRNYTSVSSRVNLYDELITCDLKPKPAACPVTGAGSRTEQ